MIVYKLFRKLKNGKGITSLFINKTRILPLNTWLIAENYPTKGYANRPFWHCCGEPNAPHLSMKNRIWKKVEIKDYQLFQRPESQGNIWYLAKQIKILDDGQSDR